MSRDKHRSRERRMELLRECAWTHNGVLLGVLCHAEGGMAMDNPDLQRLVREGLVQFRRLDWRGRGFPPKRFSRFWREIHGLSMVNQVVRTRAVVTPRGEAVLARLRLPVPLEGPKMPPA